jgi:hypothetical protein
MPAIPELTIGDFVLFFILIFLSVKILFLNDFRISRFCLILLIVTSCHLIFYVALFQDLNSECLYKTGHYLFPLFIFTFFTKNFFDYEFALSAYKKVAVISALFLILQFILAIFTGFYLSGAIPFLEANYSFEAEYHGRELYVQRFRSFFSEPSVMAMYLCVYLSLSIYNEKNKLRNFIPEIIITIAVLLSKSSSGVGMLIIIWGIWFFSYYKKLPNALKKRFSIVLLFFIFFIIWICYKADIFQFIYEHIIDDSESNIQMSKGVYGRIGNALDFNYESLSALQKLFGSGMVSLEMFMPGYLRVFLYFGIWGLFVFAGGYLYLFFRSKGGKKILILCIIIANFFGDVMFGVASMFYFPYIFASVKKYNDIIKT